METSNEMNDELMKGFHQLSRSERLERIRKLAGLTEQEIGVLSGEAPLSFELAEHFIENVVGYFSLPLGVATYFKIDGKNILIPMAVEETSIVAAASAAAKWIAQKGEIRTYNKGKLIIGQIQIPKIKNPEKALKILNQQRLSLVEFANSCIPGIVKRCGGVRDLVFRELDRPDGLPGNREMLVIHILCDPCDAMGANLINQVCEALKPRIEELTGEQVGLCILSNLVDSRLAGAEVIIRDVEPELAQGIEEATLFAQADPYRAATHNKGVLNGIDAVLIATGNDWRAVEAGVHAYAARSGKYQPVTSLKREGTSLFGKIEIPLSVGTVGGLTQAHPTAQIALKILKVKKADDLARICAAVGLVQNLGALKALASVGIVKGHMLLHAANLAIAAGAEVHEIAAVKERLAQVLQVKRRIDVSEAKEILDHLRLEK